jgi:hypothetical protein
MSRPARRGSIKWTEPAERLGRALNASALAAQDATSGDIPWRVTHTLMRTAGDPLPSARNQEMGLRMPASAAASRCSSSVRI